ncbi:MAG: GYD domain-containing protein [Betaproteobacteria bacterium]
MPLAWPPAAAFVNNPQDRVAGARAVVEKMGGTFESMDYCLGEFDLVAIAGLPDDVTAAALALAVNAPGHIKSYKTTRLMSSQEFLAAQQKAHGVAYQAPNLIRRHHGCLPHC